MNTVGIIAHNNILYERIVKQIGENNRENILIEYLSNDELQMESILMKIDLLNDKKADFIIMDDINYFLDFENLQSKSPLLILHPVDTLVLVLGRDLNQFPLWVLDNKLANRLLDLHGFSYQIADKQTKENLLKLKSNDLTINQIENILENEVSRYKPYGVDSIILTDAYITKDIEQIDELDLYKLEDSYIKEVINLLNK